ncbi:MAG: CHAT domain-containing protein [Nitrospirae bacterium]|nr:CHAT domain-containing protein [Nitrospirota bacterium]
MKPMRRVLTLGLGLVLGLPVPILARADAKTADSLYREGLKLYEKGDRTGALDTWKRAYIEMERRIEEERKREAAPSSEREILLASKKQLVESGPSPWGLQTAMGAASLDLGRHEQAVDHFTTALELAREFSSARGESDARLGLSLAYVRLADYPASRRSAELALAGYDKLEERRGALDSLIVLGISAFSMGDHPTAERAQLAALELAGRLDHPPTLAILHNNLGELAKARGQATRAVRDHLKALDRAEQGDADLRDAISINLAEDYLVMGRTERALQIATGVEAGVRAREADPDLCWRAAYVLAGILEAVGDAEGAMAAYGRAAGEVDRLRMSLLLPSNKIRFHDDKHKVYESGAALAAKQGRFDESFAFLERGRARTLLDVLYGAGSATAPATSAVQRESDPLDEPEGLSYGLVYAAFDSGEGAARPRLKAAPRDARPALSAESVPVLSPDQVRAHLPPKTALIEYAQMGGRSVAYVVTPERWVRVELPEAPLALGAQIRRFRADVVEDVSLETLQGRAYVKVLEQLYAALVAPLEGAIGPASHLVIVPTRELYYLPFAALVDSEGRYLVERWSVSYLPSASALPLYLEGKPRPLNRLLALGNPKTDRPPLPQSEAEVRAVARHFRKADVLVGESASRGRLLAMADQADALLISAHAELLPDSPLDSPMYLASGPGEEGKLTVADLFGLRLKPDLVVMSGCQTALGTGPSGADLGRGDEWVSLARGFLQAGVRTVVGTLWRVPDQVTPEVVAGFFERINNGESRAAALRGAQKDLTNPQKRVITTAKRDQDEIALRGTVRVSELRSHPFFWASMILVGDWR